VEGAVFQNRRSKDVMKPIAYSSYTPGFLFLLFSSFYVVLVLEVVSIMASFFGRGL